MIDLAPLSPLERAALGGLALGGLPRPRAWLVTLLADPAARPGVAAPPDTAAVQGVLQSLQSARLALPARRPGQWRLAAALVAPLWQLLLERDGAPALRARLAHADQTPLEFLASDPYARFPTLEAAIARLRLELLSGAPREALRPLLARLPWAQTDAGELQSLMMEGLDDPALLHRLDPSLQAELLEQRLRDALATLDGRGHEGLAAQVQAWLAQPQAPRAAALRWRWAEWLLWSAPEGSLRESLAAALAPLDEPEDAPMRAAFDGAALLWLGDPVAAAAAIDAAQAALRKASGKRRGVLPPTVAQCHALALLAQASPSALAQALKFCLAEGGRREPVLDQPLGLVAHALRMRLGEVPRSSAAFRPYLAPEGQYLSPLDPWRWLMRAWLVEDRAGDPPPPAEALMAERLLQRLQDLGLTRWAGQLTGALEVLRGEPGGGFVLGQAQESWQQALAALAALAQPAPAAASADSRLLWLLSLRPDGRPEALVPHEQARGARGWNKPRPVPLQRLQRSAEALAPHDRAVALAIRQARYGVQLRIDLAAAVAALVGHPAVTLAEAPDRLLELVEAPAELDVQQEGGQLRVRLLPRIDPGRDEAQARWGGSAEEQKELEALRWIVLQPEGGVRWRVVRLSEPQRRAAQLLGPDGLLIPPRGAAQLQQALAGLGTHFRIHSDDAVAVQVARECTAEPRLRAELQPLGDGLQLRLVACPFGEAHAAEGPRLVPGHGRARLVLTLGGEVLGVQRDLARERSHLESVLDACPMLSEPPPGAPCEWQVDEPELALALLERLSTLNAVAALDWPQGRAVRVAPAGLAGLVLNVRSRQDWLGLQGELQVDESLVLSLQQLLSLAADRRSRFLPLGEGRFLALTQELRERIDDLAAVTEHHQQRGADLADLRVPAVAAPWLQQLGEGAQCRFDAAFARRLERLDEARRVVPAVPATLQATLRPYQEEGVEWALRLAHAGLGACLADDMGLGKTLQALAVLLARAAGGPALVVAPTSLLGNWRAEAGRFAPSLRVALYAEAGAPGERAAALQDLGPADVLLVSYPMLLADAEAFAAREWHTLVLDEAQAIKNAAARRSQAVFGLRAAFRLALSGTPVENRLAELWSVMHAVNPGLLGTAQRFGERFVALIERQHDRAAQRTLRRLIAPFVLRRTKAQVLADLPPRTELVLRVAAEPQEAAHYEALRRDTLAQAERALNGEAPGQAHLNILAGLTRLRRAACDPRLVSPGIAWSGAKVRAFADLAAELVANGHKALVFSQFVDFLALLREPLDAAGIAYQYLDGSTPAAERTRRVEAFQRGEGELFLISLKAGGFGLNLTQADYVVIADPWWNPAVEDQASGRAHRIGQQRPVTVYRLVREGTLEDRILSLHQGKRELADAVLDGSDVRAAPAPEELLALMRGDEALGALYDES